MPACNQQAAKARARLSLSRAYWEGGHWQPSGRCMSSSPCAVMVLHRSVLGNV